MNSESSALLASQWTRAAAELGVKIVVPAVVTAENGVSFLFAACLPEFGAPRGTLIQTTYERMAADVAKSQGFAISTMMAETRLEYHVDSFKECLVDWGWTAMERSPPSWYLDATADGV